MWGYKVDDGSAGTCAFRNDGDDLRTFLMETPDLIADRLSTSIANLPEHWQRRIHWASARAIRQVVVIHHKTPASWAKSSRLMACCFIVYTGNGHCRPSWRLMGPGNCLSHFNDYCLNLSISIFSCFFSSLFLNCKGLNWDRGQMGNHGSGHVGEWAGSRVNFRPALNRQGLVRTGNESFGPN